MTKTFKREIAVASLICWFIAFFVTLYVAATTTNPNLSVMTDLVVGASLPIFGLVAGAFGLDAYAKQLGRRLEEDSRPIQSREPQRHTEHGEFG